MSAAAGRLLSVKRASWVEGECPENSICVGSACSELICEANTARCLDETQLGICSANGTAEEI